MKIIASNFKMNHNRVSTRKYLEKLDDFLSIAGIKEKVYVFPPCVALDSYQCESNIIVGVQNAYPKDKGSFTGEIGLEQLNEFNIKSILIGHSERRHILKESQNLIVEKFNFYKQHNFDIIYCIGEPLQIKEKGIDETLSYLWDQLKGIDLDYEKLIIAYEPVWAIGTGISATIDDITQIHKALRTKINTPLLYGGSVKVSNLSDILKIENVDGVLVGTASWEVENFIEMAKIAKEL
jgi:triosephosphate isomerase